MTENLNKKPAKGILKTSSSHEQAESNKNAADIEWDEMNILQTLHPPDKDYGHMKIEEPKTPYSYYEDNSGQEISGHGSDTLDADLLTKKMNSYSENEEKEKPKVLEKSDSSSEEENEEETEEEKAQRSAFEYKRKMHYNEFYAVKLARKLIDNDEDEQEVEEENSN